MQSLAKSFAVVLVGLTLSVRGASFAAAQAPSVPPSSTSPADAAAPGTSPKRALAAARAVAAQAKGKQGPERAAALAAGAKAYLAVAATFATEPGVAAEASFEAGELWRRKGDLTEAETAYRAALEQDAQRYGARASFELAHLQRRGKKFDKAVELYRKVAEMQPGSARAQDALLWIGRTWQAATKLDAAIGAFEAALQAATTPAAVIAAGNWLAKARIGKGDYAGARATLAEVDARVAQDIAGDAASAQRLQAALAEMSARRALQRALDKRNQAGADAVAVDEGEADDDENGDEEDGGGGHGEGKKDTSKPAKAKPVSAPKKRNGG